MKCRDESGIKKAEKILSGLIADANIRKNVTNEKRKLLLKIYTHDWVVHCARQPAPGPARSRQPAPGPAAGTGPGSRHRYREEARECAPTSGKYVSPSGAGGYDESTSYNKCFGELPFDPRRSGTLLG